MKFSKYSHVFILITSGGILLCTPFAGSTGLQNGLVIGKVCWLHLAMLFFCICLTGILPTVRNKNISYSFSDGIVLLLTGIVLATYNWELHPEPEKLLFGGQLIALWFLLRIVLITYPLLRLSFLLILMLTGLVEAIWGMQQLHGYTGSNHSLFRLTGTFFNPGPYSGYLAVILPVCLWMVLRFRLLFHYFAWICVVAIAVVLPAGMSRSAWIATVVACGWVYGAESWRASAC